MGSKSHQPSARFGDIGSNHGAWPPTPITSASPDVMVNGIPAARQGDSLLPHAKPNSPPHGRSIAEGASSVLINGRPAARVTDAISCGGKVIVGSGNTLIGDNGGSGNVEPPVPVFNERFVLRDIEGNPLERMPYKITTASGEIHKGVTDYEGYTRKVFTDAAEGITIEPDLDDWE